MVAAALVALVLACIWTVVAIASLVWLVVYLVRSRREESCCEDCDDWMAVADVVSDDHAAALAVVDDHFAEDYADDGVCLEGLTPEETETLRRNYEPVCDDERIRLGVAFESIARCEGLAGMVRRVLAEHRAQTGADQ